MPEITNNEDWIAIRDRGISYQIIHSPEKQPNNELRMVTILVDPEGLGTLRVIQEFLNIKTAGVLRATKAEL